MSAHAPRDVLNEVSAKEAERLTHTLEMLPHDARNALEIGFNDLRVTRLLAHQLDLVSVDLPRATPTDVGGCLLAFASISSLPFWDRRFDLIVCTEVLEHLQEDVLTKGVSEISRVGSRYLLVSVPFKQRVWNQMWRCGVCGHQENCMGHVRGFGMQELVRLFPSFGVRARQLVSTEPGYAPDWLYALARRLGNVWHPHCKSECPSCGTLDTVPIPNVFGRTLQRVIWRVEAILPKRPAWLVVLLERRSESASRTAGGQLGA